MPATTFRITPLSDADTTGLPAGLDRYLSAAQGQMIALLDGAQITNLQELLETSGLQHQSVFHGDSAAAGPWLVALEPENRFTTALFQASDAPWHLWGKHRLVLLQSRCDLQTLGSHFRKLVRVGPIGTRKMFRFWDGAILYDYLMGTDSMPDRQNQIFGHSTDHKPVCNAITLWNGEIPDTLTQFKGPAAPLPGSPRPFALDETDVKILQDGADKRLTKTTAAKLFPKFDEILPEGHLRAEEFAKGALRFIRHHGAGQSVNLAEDCFQLAVLAFLLGDARNAVLQGPVMSERLVPISTRIALTRESYFSTLQDLQSSQKETT